MGRPKTNIHPYDEEKYRKLIREYDSSWILLILRNYTDRENPKSVNEIAGMIVRATGIGSDGRDFSKTVGRRLDDLIEGWGKSPESQEILPFNYSAEGAEGKLCDLEELLSEGNSYDGNAEHHAPEEIGECHFQSAEKEPEYVQKEGSYAAVVISHHFSKGVKGYA